MPLTDNQLAALRLMQRHGLRDVDRQIALEVTPKRRPQAALMAARNVLRGLVKRGLAADMRSYRCPGDWGLTEAGRQFLAEHRPV